MKVTRRKALESAGLLGIAGAIGCDTGDGASPDGGTDAATPTADAQPRPMRDAGPAPTGPFRHGVASGDPLPDAVILWTRVTIDGMPSISVEWEMSTDPAFGAIDATGTATTDASRDFTVKVDAGGLAAATTYYYRFRVAGTGDASPIGRTRTAPAAGADVARLRFAVVSCSSYAHGWFHGYRNVARRADLDAVIHLGDYIYEYGTGEYGLVRDYDPPHEITTLADYRRRYAYYREDPDVAEVHRQHPFVCVWDDHETADNSWRDGASNHQAAEGGYGARKAAAQQAYSEWLPIRAADPSRIYRTLRYGALAEVILLDTRIEGRTEQGEGEPADRSIVSAEQEAFLLDALASSAARWKLIAQQVVFTPFPAFPNTDAWDGYPVQRDRVLDAIAAIDDVIVLTGDVHMSYALEVVRDPDARPVAPVAVEFVAPGITSPALSDGPIADAIVRNIMRDMPYAKHYDLVNKGYVVLDLDASRAQADFVVTEAPTDPYDASERDEASWAVATGAHTLTAATTSTPPADPPALAPV